MKLNKSTNSAVAITTLLCSQLRYTHNSNFYTWDWVSVII